jgi:hypothetical protein
MATPGVSIPKTEHDRGVSAKAVLKLEWDYPTFKAEEKVTTGSTARAVRRALTDEAAFRYIAGDDPRPLLVLRECEVCNGTDEALLSKGADNERTFLLSTWFHCVKLPVDVLETNHPFYELFGHDDPEHLFVAMPDGSLKVKLESQTSRTELWDAMNQVLAASYKSDPQPAVKLVQKSLDRMDVLDQKLLELRTKKNELLETEGATSKKLAKINLEIEEAKQEIAASMQAIAKASKLELKNGEAKPTTEAGKAGQ